MATTEDKTEQLLQVFTGIATAMKVLSKEDRVKVLRALRVLFDINLGLDD